MALEIGLWRVDSGAPIRTPDADRAAVLRRPELAAYHGGDVDQGLIPDRLARLATYKGGRSRGYDHLIKHSSGGGHDDAL